jgi:acyl-CoA reductase-like NAD-dependent aldehyde dehydrogenase
MPTTLDVETGLPVVPLWIGGAATTSSPPLMFPVYSAIKQKQVFLAHAADSAAATRAVDSAAAAFKTWRKTSPTARRDILLRAADIMESRKAEIVSMEIEETSCGQPWALFNVESTVDIIREIASRVTSTCAGEMPSTANEGALSLVFHEPIGPVLLIAP